MTDAIVTSRRSERWGQEIVAVVAPRQGAETSGLHDELRDHCRGSLAGYKVPKAVLLGRAGRPLPRRQARLRLGADGRRRPAGLVTWVRDAH